MIWQHIIKITLNHIVIYERKNKMPKEENTSTKKADEKDTK